MGVDLGHAERLQHLIARHVGQVEIEKDDVVVVELAEIDAFFAQIGRVDIEAFGLEHQLDALGRCGIVLDQQNPHLESPMVRLPGGSLFRLVVSPPRATRNKPLTLRLR